MANEKQTVEQTNDQKVRTATESRAAEQNAEIAESKLENVAGGAFDAF